ncbi:polyprenol phosphomannose-dependent alpha 1,6 mannosyltransferase MptB [Dactylosporangium aurantiacum]|uniref:Polyprenol phosphomannose-dependent alpha 1,6 mannosyltransferase MptB n=1 Tax=Dactylosporangium aurantiacum TaxID=35754 RepID=A0A9Q9MG96_9ACTN|nr:polyprenol phosphomannose-dependent alpha 1,6 mannosyltransferase MptB [Dactylosporangium aurantiacum]MDG6102166.1 polyprenol phosphomannose-dependent alpha 1,6 mannosyltransferase MptB [Dactylosporangium aurantiacum]UWZ53515.1 polyprenol phosphomannose-dependent alpha 1,6 mannosyltransferase MptB [Dactylosporangium aurantiacum]
MSVNPRWLGLAATVLLAASGFLAGKPQPRDGAWLLGLLVWFVALALLIRAWWALREDTRQRSVLVTAAIWSVPLLFAPSLGSHDVYAYACQGQLFNAGLNLYEVGPAALPCTWLSDVPELWRDTPTPYGPLWIAVEGAAAWLAHGSLPVAVLLLRVAAILGLLLCVAAVRHLSRGNALLAASPLVLVHVVSGAHNDVVLAGLLLAGFVAARRPGPAAGAASGIAVGLAVAVKVTALVAAPFAVLLLFFAGTPRSRWTAPLAFTGAIGATYAILALLTGHGLGFLHALGSTSTMVQWLSIPTGVGMAVDYVLRVAGHSEWGSTTVAVARAVGLLALAVVLLVLWWRAARTLAALARGGAQDADLHTDRAAQGAVATGHDGHDTGAARDAAPLARAGQGGSVADGVAGRGLAGLGLAGGGLAGGGLLEDGMVGRRGQDVVLTAAGCGMLAAAVLGPVFYAWYALAGIALLAGTTLSGRLRTVVHVAAAGLPLLTLPDSLGLATKTKAPGAFLDVALVTAAAVHLVRRRRRARSALPAAPAPATSGSLDDGNTHA